MAAVERLSLELGALSKPFSDQLASQGIPFDAETIRHLELDALAISRLKVRGVVSYSAGNRLYDKIFKSVWAEARRAATASPEGGSTGAPDDQIQKAVKP